MQRKAVVTGASRGIGLAASKSLAAAGFTVFMIGRRSDVLAAAANEVGGVAVRGDVTDPSGELLDSLRRELAGEPDVLVNNAGLFLLRSVAGLSPDELSRSFDANLLAPFRLVHAFLPGMIARGSGDIISIGSIADRTTFPENAAYAGSKHALRVMHETLRMELRGTGVRAALVSPGPVDTEIWEPVDPDNRPGFTPRARMLAASAVGEAVAWVATRPPEVTVDELRLSRS